MRNFVHHPAIQHKNRLWCGEHNRPTQKIAWFRYKGLYQIMRNITATDAYVRPSFARKDVERLFVHLKRILCLMLRPAPVQMLRCGAVPAIW